MDNKYGQLYTAQDLANIAAVLLHGVVPPENLQESIQEAVTHVARSSKLHFPVDEPLFLLRAQDQAAPAAIHGYLDAAKFNGAAPAHQDSITRSAIEFVQWQAANPNKVKIPD